MFWVVFWIVVAILCFIGPSIPDWVKSAIEKRQQQKDKHTEKTLVNEWNNGQKNHERDYTNYSVHYLNPAGELKTISVIEFTKLSMPTEDLPNEWILRCSKVSEGFGRLYNKLCKLQKIVIPI